MHCSCSPKIGLPRTVQPWFGAQTFANAKLSFTSNYLEAFFLRLCCLECGFAPVLFNLCTQLYFYRSKYFTVTWYKSRIMWHRLYFAWLKIDWMHWNNCHALVILNLCIWTVTGCVGFYFVCYFAAMTVLQRLCFYLWSFDGIIIFFF